jgi:hypothetical protein
MTTTSAKPRSESPLRRFMDFFRARGAQLPGCTISLPSLTVHSDRRNDLRRMAVRRIARQPSAPSKPSSLLGADNSRSRANLAVGQYSRATCSACLTSETTGVIPAEFQTPPPDRFVRDEETAFEQHLLDKAHAQGETEIEPDGVANRFLSAASPRGVPIDRRQADTVDSYRQNNRRH